MLVAIIGVVVPFGLGVFIIGPLVFPTLPFIAHLFLGAALTATSVGITARVFQDLGIGGSRESQIVVNAAVIDDVLGLIILAVVVGLAETGSISIVGIGIISFKAITFLFLSIFLGLKLAGPISRLFSAISSGVGMKLTIALAFAVGFAYLATKVGLANIVGAYAAGLVLDHVHFTRFRRPRIAEDLESLSCCLQDDESKKKVNNLLNESCDRHVEDLITDVSYILTPLFFVFTGMAVKFSALSDPKVWGIGAVVIIVAIIGKIVSGLGAGPGVNKWLVGVGMVPRGEVGLIFATLGLSLGIVSPELFAIIVLMVIVTTLCTPPVLGLLSKRSVKVQP